MQYDFTNPMGLDENECRWLKAFCRQHNIRSAIEFGPGNSTVAMLEGGVLRIMAFEESPSRCNELAEIFQERVSINLYGAQDWPSLPTFRRGRHYGLAFIDAPTGSSVYPARLNACLACLQLAHLLVIHDAKRDTVTIRVLCQLGCAVIDGFDSPRGMAVLRTPIITPAAG